MAQALFDEHPLEKYLRDAGESSLTMPGISSELEHEMDPYFDFVNDSLDDVLPDWLPQYIIEFLELLQSTISSAQSPNKSNSSVERFKYNIISSSLLVPSLPTSHAKRSSRTLSFPGQHSVTPSEDLDRPLTPCFPPTNSSDPSYGPISFSIASMAISLSIGYPHLALLSAIGTLFLLYLLIYTTETSKHDMTFPFNALDDLIVASNMWESTVQDAVTLLDKEERTHVPGFSGASSPSPLRVALHSCLQATHSQCDNIRHLFTALTSPTNLSQISEMYAPPSPTKSTFETSSPPFSFPSPHRQSAAPTTPQNKRSTWNGSYASLAYTSSPTSLMVRRRDRHRMNLSDVFHPGTSSAPATPFLPTPSASLSQVPEHPTVEGLPSSDSNLFSPVSSHFGAAVLDLQRKRRSGGMEAFSQRPGNLFSDLKSPRSARNNLFSSTITSPSKFTNAQTSRHPLSYSALNTSLQGALAAKRYTCSHLLALRFEDDEDEGYWEDVRSIIGLLTSSLSDGFSRLSAALDEVEQQNLEDQNPTPETSISHLDFSGAEDNFSQAVDLEGEIRRRKHKSKTSFAPMPTHVSRFAAHVAAIGSALDDARENLEQCVAALKSDPTSSPTFGSPRHLRHSRSRSRMMATPAGEEAEAEESSALQAYERLRRELGMALRECERGRERLLELVNPPIPSDDEDDEFDDLPGLGHDGSESSDKPEANSPCSGDEDDLQTNAARFPLSVVTVEGVSVDDATSHLLLATSSQHLPMPGIEEVFEADTGAKVAFNRERSKLSRKERIILAKERRESGMELALGVGGGECGGGEGEHVKIGLEKWGPGGEVVQELKDVIWKVGERKRKMADSAQSQSDASPSSTLESA